jgi:ProP effector
MIAITHSKRRAAIDAVLDLFVERFPRTFAIYEHRRRPLKIGIHADIAAQLDGAITPDELSNALRFYTGNVGYLRSLIAGAARVDLDGAPAGVVSQNEAEHAKALLIARRAKKAMVTPPAPQPAAAPARRDGLADLKIAALKRRQASAGQVRS